MILTHKGRRLITFDQDTKAFIDAAGLNTDANINSGGLYNSEQARMYVHYVVSGLKSIGIWNKMKAVYVFIGGTATTHKFNLKDPRDLDAAFRLVFPNGITHSNIGIKGNGTTQYAETNLSPNVSLVAGDSHLSMFKGDSLVGDYRDMGSMDGTVVENPSLALTASYVNKWILYTGNNVQYSGGGEKGYYLTSSKSNRLIVGSNGNILSDIAYSQLSLPVKTINIGRYNSSGTIYYSPTHFSFASIGNGLTNQEAIQFSQLVQFVQGYIGRKI